MSKQSMLTTVDNPFDPFEQFSSWLARIANVSESMSETEFNNEIDSAIDKLIKVDFLDIYKKVTKEVPDDE